MMSSAASSNCTYRLIDDVTDSSEFRQLAHAKIWTPVDWRDIGHYNADTNWLLGKPIYNVGRYRNSEIGLAPRYWEFMRQSIKFDKLMGKLAYSDGSFQSYAVNMKDYIYGLYKSVTAKAEKVSAGMLASGLGCFERKAQTLIRETRQAIRLANFVEEKHTDEFKKALKEITGKAEASEVEEERNIALDEIIRVTDVYGFQDCFAFVNREKKLDVVPEDRKAPDWLVRLEDNPFPHVSRSDKDTLEIYRSWFRLLTGDYISFEHMLYSQKHLDEFYLNDNYPCYKFRFYGYLAKEALSLASHLQLIPENSAGIPGCMDLIIRNLRNRPFIDLTFDYDSEEEEAARWKSGVRISGIMISIEQDTYNN